MPQVNNKGEFYMSENSNTLNIVQVCNYLGVGPVTLNRWYTIQQKIKESGEYPDMPDLPPFQRVNNTPRGAKYWYVEDLDKFQAFIEWRQTGRAGKFGKYNAKYWGETGVKALLKKGEIDEIRQNFSYFKNRIHDPHIIEQLKALGFDCSDCSISENHNEE